VELNEIDKNVTSNDRYLFLLAQMSIILKFLHSTDESGPMSRVSKDVASFLILIGGKELSDKEISGVIANIGNKYIDKLSETAYNLCVAGSVSLSSTDYNYLRRFQSALTIIANRKLALKKRRSALSSTPKLARRLAQLFVSIWLKE